MLNNKFPLEITPNDDGSYKIHGTRNNFTKFLIDMSPSKKDAHLINTETGMNNWIFKPIDTSNEYIGIHPDVKTADGDYYGTIYAGFDFRLVSPGMSAYYVSSTGVNNLTMERIESNIIPAETPVIIKCKSVNSQDNIIEPVVGDFKFYEKNCLEGVYCSLYVAGHHNVKRYDDILMRIIGLNDKGELAFVSTPPLYRLYKEQYLMANKAYLKVKNSDADIMKAILPPDNSSNITLTGDVNHDGYIDRLDLEAIVAYLMREGQDVFDIDLADINGDQNINAADIVAFINKGYVSNPFFRILSKNYIIDEKGGVVFVNIMTDLTAFDVFPTQDSWVEIGNLERTEPYYYRQTINVAPFTEKTPQRSTTIYMHDKSINITQIRNLYIKESGLNMILDDSEKLNLYLYKDDTVIWSSSNENVATVDANGNVTAVGVGNAIIKVTSSDGKYEDSVPVSVVNSYDLRDYLKVEWNPQYESYKLSSVSCKLINNSKRAFQLTKCELLYDTNILSSIEYSEVSGAMEPNGSKKATFDNLNGGTIDKFSVVWYYKFNGVDYTYKCDYYKD